MIKRNKLEPHWNKLEIIKKIKLRIVKARASSLVKTKCWLWLGGRNSTDYGTTRFDGRDFTVHRLAYLAIIGPVSDDLDLDHICRNRGCCNPAHLEAVSRKVNCNRGNTGLHQRSKTHCPKGHEYSAENTYTSRGERQCRICKRTNKRNLRERKRNQ